MRGCERVVAERIHLALDASIDKDPDVAVSVRSDTSGGAVELGAAVDRRAVRYGHCPDVIGRQHRAGRAQKHKLATAVGPSDIAHSITDLQNSPGPSRATDIDERSNFMKSD